MAQIEYIKDLYENEGVSLREISRRTGHSFQTVQKYAYREDWGEKGLPDLEAEHYPNLEKYIPSIDEWTEADRKVPRKQRHTATRIYRRLVEEQGYQGSFRTKERYYEAMQRFCRFLSEEYRLQKLANINGKHLAASVLYLQEQGLSAATIKTELAAIRFFHDKMERTKYRLPSNDELAVELECRRFGGVDRTWSVREFNLFLATCMADGHEDFAAIACLTWYAGLRIHECLRIDTAIAEQALRESAITIKGKGGKIRTVPINESIRIELKKMLAVTERGHKLFVADDELTHTAIGRLQQYIYKMRSQIQDEGSTRPMTHHGLRHSFAARTYQELIDSGVSPLNASLRVSQLLGHERPDVTNVYLTSVKDGPDGK